MLLALPWLMATVVHATDSSSSSLGLSLSSVGLGRSNDKLMLDEDLGLEEEDEDDDDLMLGDSAAEGGGSNSGDSGDLFSEKNLENSIAAVFNKVAYGSTTTKRSIPDVFVPSLTTIATPSLTTYR